MDDQMIGEIRLFAGNFAPSGWYSCEGQLIAVNSNQALFSILSTTYGGDGVNNFALPDLRGAFPTQYNSVGGNPPSGSSYRLGQRGGSPNAVITGANLPAHTHSITKGGGSNLTGNVGVTTTISVNNTDTGSSEIPSAGNSLSAVRDIGGAGGAGIYNSASPNTALNAATANSSVVNTLSFDPTGLTLTPAYSGGTSSSIPVTPPFVAMIYIIAWQGVYPTRP